MFDIENIESPDFIKDLSIKELKILADDIRKFLIDNVSKTGGHLSSNLGVVEITLALFYVFDYKNDKFLYDVSHQSYVHKILTGRAKDFKTLRQHNGMSGYTNPKESKFDFWDNGHSSSTISAMTGMLLTDKKSKVISIIGDSSINNGLAFEGMNFSGSIRDIAPIVLLNDNEMGISKSVGSFSYALSKLRTSKFYLHLKRHLNAFLPHSFTNLVHRFKRMIKSFFQHDNFFEDLGYNYFGPINGHDIRGLIANLERIKKLNEPCILHVLTEKGKGYEPAENDKTGYYHGIGPFDVNTGLVLKHSKPNTQSYSEIVADYLCDKRRSHKFNVITPAMIFGQKLMKFQYLFPENLFDVGIAESHAATMAAGMAVNHFDVVLLLYSTFSQRAYDQILNDICRQNLKVIIGVDRAGVVGADGSTHQGVYDVSMFNHMPNIKISMPSTAEECRGLFDYAFSQESPMVIRYPRASESVYNLEAKKICNEAWINVKNGNKAIVISYGPDLNRIEKIIDDNSLDVRLINAIFIKPIDKQMLSEVFSSGLPILVYEEVVSVGSLTSSILNYATNSNFTINKFHSMGFSQDDYIAHGQIPEVLKDFALDDESILKEIIKIME